MPRQAGPVAIEAAIEQAIARIAPPASEEMPHTVDHVDPTPEDHASVPIDPHTLAPLGAAPGITAHTVPADMVVAASTELVHAMLDSEVPSEEPTPKRRRKDGPPTRPDWLPEGWDCQWHPTSRTRNALPSKCFVHVQSGRTCTNKERVMDHMARIS